MKPRPGIVTLITDFGAGPYVGAMKGVILATAPGTTIVDISHEISPQEIIEAAFVLAQCAFDFPPGTVHLAVVDPGVGTSRRIILAEANGEIFLAPDNGLLTLALAKGGKARAWSVENPNFFRHPVRATFHGRDIFAPVAGAIAAGEKPDAFGPEIPAAEVRRLKIAHPRKTAGGIAGEVIFVDRFGNLVTNITASTIGRLASPGRLTVACAGRKISGLKRTYADAAAGDLAALIGSFGLLEIAVANGSAADFLGGRTGEKVTVRRT